MNKLVVLLTVVLCLTVSDLINAEEVKTNQHQRSAGGHEAHEHETRKEMSSDSKKTQVYYTCSMHPQIKEGKPGKCPICHMNLTKIEVEEEEHVVESEAHAGHKMQKENSKDVVAKVRLRKAQLKHFFPQYVAVSPMKMLRKVRLLGAVLQSEEKESSIPARISGRVEKVYIKSTGSMVRAGDPVVDLYSPKLITAGEEYLLARQTYNKKRGIEFKDLLRQSEERLRLWGIKAFQYEKWYKNRKVPRHITIFSNSSGIVRRKNASVGKYFKEGQNFLELSDLADVWVEMDVYEQDSSLIQLGQEVELEFAALPGEVLSGEIDFINPVLDSKSRTLKVRATIPNSSGKLKPGMIADAVINIEIEGKPLVVPRSAIIDTGTRKVVWIKVNDKEFQAKVIHTGIESQGYVEIKHGLQSGDEVVLEGNFLLDAQAQLFGGYEGMKKNSAHQH